MHVKVGDIVLRMLAGEVPMKLRVTKVDELLIHCAALDAPVDGWTFDRATGVEEDEDLRWGVRFGRTGSYLVEEAVS